MKKLIAFLLSLTMLAPFGFARPTSKDVDSASQTTALQLIDDAIYADDADWTDDTSKHALVGGLYQTSQQTVTNGDVAPLQLDPNGNLRIAVMSYDNTISTPVNAVLLDDDPTSYTSAAISVWQYTKVGIWWSYDETEVGNSVSAALTLTGSVDGTNFSAIGFYDTAGSATIQTSESLSADGSYICWLNPDLPLNQIKVTITATNTDADDTANNTVKVYVVK